MGDLPADIPSGWLAIISLLVSASIAAVAYVWKQRDLIYLRQIQKLEAEVAAGREKINRLQDEAHAALRAQLTDALNRTIVDKRNADQAARTNELLAKLLAERQP